MVGRKVLGLYNLTESLNLLVVAYCTELFGIITEIFDCHDELKRSIIEEFDSTANWFKIQNCCCKDYTFQKKLTKFGHVIN